MILRLSLSLLVLSTIFSLCLADIQPIDVEPVLKKEQPDFEDDTGDRSHLKDEDTLPKKVMSGKLPDEGEGDLVSSFTNSKNLDFTHAFVASLTVIIVSELGDKTFFIAAIMAMTNPRVTVFLGAMTALTIMHLLSALFGYVITYIPRVYTFYASSALFAFFGLKMLYEGYRMKRNVGQEELEEVQMDLRRREDNEDRDRDRDRDRDVEREAVSVEEGGVATVTRPETRRNLLLRRLLCLTSFVPRKYLEALTLTFLAEWGDRSQIATVVMSTSNDLYGIIVGGLLGHFLCTGVAVIGGKLVASKISVKTVTLLGGVVFLIFAVTTVIMGP